MVYGNVYDMSDALGEFDVAVLAAVLTHMRSPVEALTQCAKRAKTIIVTDAFRPETEITSMCRLVPTRENQDTGTWWHFSTSFIQQFLRVLGYEVSRPMIHTQDYKGHPAQMFTIIGKRPS